MRPPATEPAKSRNRRATARLTSVIIPLVLVLASLAMAWTVTAHHSSAFSPRDEWVYLDYVQKVASQGFIHQGEVVGIDPRERMSCDGVRPYGPMGPACGTSPADLSAYPQQAINTADIYTPLYFVPTRIAAAGVQLVTGADPLVATRLTGGLWLAGTMLVFYGMIRSFRVRPLAGLGLGLAFIASPLAWWTYTYISTDAPTFLLTSAGLWLAHLYARGRAPGWTVVVFASVAVLFKATNFLSVGLITLYLVLDVAWRLGGSWRTKRMQTRPTRRDINVVTTALLAVILALSAQTGWLAVRALAAVGPSPDQGNLAAFSVREAARLAVMVIPETIISNSTVNPSGSNSYLIPVYLVEPLSWICVVAILGSIWQLRSRAADGPIVIAISIASVLFVPALALALTHVQGSYFPLPARYGAPILAGILLAAGLLLKNRWATYCLVAYSALLVLYVIQQAPALA